MYNAIAVIMWYYVFVSVHCSTRDVKELFWGMDMYEISRKLTTEKNDE